MLFSDLGWVDEDGYVYLAGHQEDVIIRKGEDIPPAEIEMVRRSRVDVAETAVIGYPDEE